MIIFNEERVSAILALQKKRNSYSPGSHLFEIYDKAIDLAFNPQRQVNEYLYRNLLRDAKRILQRKTTRSKKVICFENDVPEDIGMNRNTPPG